MIRSSIAIGRKHVQQIGFRQSTTLATRSSRLFANTFNGQTNRHQSVFSHRRTYISESPSKPLYSIFNRKSALIAGGTIIGGSVVIGSLIHKEYPDNEVNQEIKNEKERHIAIMKNCGLALRP